MLVRSLIHLVVLLGLLLQPAVAIAQAPEPAATPRPVYLPLIQGPGHAATLVRIGPNPSPSPLPTPEATPTASPSPVPTEEAFPTPAPEAQSRAAPLTLELITTVDPARVVPGELLTYTIIIVNTGPRPVTEVVLDDPLPAGLVYDPHSASGCEYVEREQRLTWNVAEIQPGQVLTGTFQARAQGLNIGEVVTNTVIATSQAITETVVAAIVVDIVAPARDDTWVSPTQGGWLRSEDGRIELFITPGAIKRPTRISPTPHCLTSRTCPTLACRALDGLPSLCRLKMKTVSQCTSSARRCN